MSGRRIRISEDENALLIRHSEGRVLHLSFGPSGVWLDPACTWPIPLLAQWRGVAFDEGAGI